MKFYIVLLSAFYYLAIATKTCAPSKAQSKYDHNSFIDLLVIYKKQTRMSLCPLKPLVKYK